MSWIHHKPSTSSQPITTSSSTATAAVASPPPTQKSLMHHPPNSSVVQQRTLTTAGLSRHQSSTTAAASSSHLIASPFPTNKMNPATNTTTMRVNNNPYQQQQQQQQQQRQQQQQMTLQQQNPQRQHLTTPTAPPLHNNNSNNNNNSNSIHVQSVFSNQQNPWQANPPQNYMPSSKMMPQAAQPPLPPAGAANNTWEHQQQQNYDNAKNNNMFQQNATAQQWPQQLQQQPPQQPQTQPQQTAPATTTTAYDNFYNQQATTNSMYQQQQQQQQTSTTYFQQQQPVATPAPLLAPAPASSVAPLPPTSAEAATITQPNAVNFFDNTNNNNQSTGDGWGDWDWNENSPADTSNTSSHVSQHHAQQQKHIAPVPSASQHQAPPAPPQQQLPPPVRNDHGQQQQQQPPYNANTIADSFNLQNSNTWNWGTSSQNEQNVAAANVDKQNAHLNIEQQHESWDWGFKESELKDPQQPNDHSNDDWYAKASENQQQISNASQEFNTKSPETQTSVAGIKTTNHVTSDSAQPPPPPPPMEFSSVALAENHNYNTNAFVAATESLPPPPPPLGAASSTNIPNTVFVSQAKPVTLPSRQYASPPTGNTPVTEHPPLGALMPPQAFQNIDDVEGTPSGISSQMPAPVATAMPPIAAVSVPVAVNAVPPPSALPNAAAGNPFKRSGVAQHHRATGLLATVPSTPAVFNMPPPPPADFANPSSSAALIEPDNNELPSQENQEILMSPGAAIAAQPQPQQQLTAISLPNSAAAVLPPPNDERNQYLQTSHLSENSEDQQPETDGLLPPPGLSRLVLGEPELEASQQRMVMGTDAPVVDTTANVTDVMHLEERHADGEDTASENAVLVANTTGQGVPPPSSSTLTSDRNLYMFPGEGNANNQQRVVTGVELREQREIEMDGENLEDQQQEQHQQQLQQQQSLSPVARNEPPVEGADESVDQQMPIPSQSLELNETHHHQANKPKETDPVSSLNDDDDSDERLLNDRNMNQSTAGSSKSRSKYDNERQTSSSRRRDKRSFNRYDSDEYNNSEDGEYSSDRDERERRERNDRRRNYREGSVRSDRGVAAEEDEKTNRRQRREKRDKYYHEAEERSRGDRSKLELKRSQHQRGYENDSRYETEESTRFDARKDIPRRSMRHPEAERTRRGDKVADYDDYNRKSGGYRSSKRSGGENYDTERRRRGGVDDYDKDMERRRRSDKHRDPRYREDPRYDPREYEEYRKHSSRNARDSDLEKEIGVLSRSGRLHHDSARQAAGMYGYPSGSYYDPYTAYYYNQMARTNPQAYAEWYKKYYGQHAAAAGLPQATMPGMAHTGEASLSAATNDGRESVHSGRSSAHNDIKDRYTHAYITQANEYHRHYHHHHQQHQLQQQQHQHHQQQQMAYNQSLNSTILDEDSLNQSTILYGGIGGLSSAHSNSNLSQIHGGYYIQSSGLGTAANTSVAAAAMYYARSDYAESRSGALSIRDPDLVATEPQRLTPCKFINEHTVVSFGSGVLVTVKPKYTSNGNISNIVKLLKFKPNDETRKLFKVFPGPLVRGLTHKKTVIEFCQEQIRLGPMETTIYAKQLISNNAEKYRSSYTLMWNLLILLLKQNGMVVGTDIAELLLKNQQQFPYQSHSSSFNISLKSKSGSNSPVEEKDLATENTEPLVEAENNDNEQNNEKLEKTKENAEESEENSLSKSSSATTSLSEDEITEKFRNYLLYGNVNEALEWATDNNLWGHALFLASKLDRRSHANVMMKFANKLALNDPLQTLYQLMSGRSPSSVTCVQDEKWGDWRPHLSMILSNTSQKPELDRKAITTLGDSLFNRGDLYAAHFCYLMAQVGFGRYQETATQETALQQHLPKLILLGSSHYKQFQDFAHNEAIVMTEIYEYACSLNDEKFSIIEFQPYKFLLASRLLDYGFHLKSLMYLEQVSVHIARDSSKYESSFINKVYEMADRLKYYDPVLEKTIDDQQQEGNEDASNATQQHMEDQKWLQSLRLLAQQYKLDYNPTAATGTAPNYEGQQQTQQEPNYNYQQQQIDQQFMEINKQFSELNLQYQTNSDTTQQQPAVFYNPAAETPQQPLMANINEQQQQPAHLDNYQSQQQSLQPEQPSIQANDLQQKQLMMNDATRTQDSYQQQQQLSYMQQQQHDSMQQQQGYSQNYYDPSQQQHQQQHYTDGSVDTQAATANSYDYWSQQQQQTVAYGEENARPTISMPKSKRYDSDDDGADSKHLGGAQKSSQNESAKGGNQQQQKNKDKDSKSNLPSNQNSGWFGGIWNKFSLKPKNQMILPDDKNPAIVWDPEKKKWVNTDGEETQEEAFRPPPKMSDIMPQMPQQNQSNNVPQMPPQPQTPQMPLMDSQQQQQQYVPTTSIPNSAPSPNPMQQQPQQLHQQPQTVAVTNQNAPGPAKTPTLQSNMFKMQRNRTLKNAYVDVFNPSGAPVNKAAENILAPALPPAAVPQGGYFVPGSGPTGSTSSQDNNGYQQQPQDTPQFYNPNQYGTGAGY